MVPQTRLGWTRMSSTSSTPGPASSGILDGKVPVFVFPVQLDFYYEDQTTHKRLVTIYNPYEFDVTFKVKILRSNIRDARYCWAGAVQQSQEVRCGGARGEDIGSEMCGYCYKVREGGQTEE